MPVNSFIFVLIAVIVVLVFSIAIKKMECLLNFFIRLFVGSIAIFLTGQIMINASLAGHLSMNPVSVLTVGFLGAPGFLALIFIELYYIS